MRVLSNMDMHFWKGLMGGLHISGEFLIVGEYDDEGNDGDGAVVVVGLMG